MRSFCCISTQKNVELERVSSFFRRQTRSFPKRILTKPGRPFRGLKRPGLPPVQKPAHVQASTRRPQERLRWTPSGRPQIRQVGPTVSESETAAGPAVSKSETAGFTAGTKPAHVQASTRRPQERLRWTPSGRPKLGRLARRALEVSGVERERRPGAVGSWTPPGRQRAWTKTGSSNVNSW